MQAVMSSPGIYTRACSGSIGRVVVLAVGWCTGWLSGGWCIAYVYVQGCGDRLVSEWDPSRGRGGKAGWLAGSAWYVAGYGPAAGCSARRPAPVHAVRCGAAAPAGARSIRTVRELGRSRKGRTAALMPPLGTRNSQARAHAAHCLSLLLSTMPSSITAVLGATS